MYFSEAQTVCVKIVGFFMALADQVDDIAKIICGIVADLFFLIFQKRFLFTDQ